MWNFLVIKKWQKWNWNKRQSLSVRSPSFCHAPSVERLKNREKETEWWSDDDRLSCFSVLSLNQQLDTPPLHTSPNQPNTRTCPSSHSVCSLCPVAVCLVLSCMTFPNGWDAEVVRDMCGEDTGRYDLGNCSVRWAYILAIISILDALILSFLAFVLGNRQSDFLLEELRADNKGETWELLKSWYSSKCFWRGWAKKKPNNVCPSSIKWGETPSPQISSQFKL